MTERRTRGEGGLRWNERRQRWIAEMTIGYDGRGKRIVRSTSGRTRTEAKTKLRALKEDQADGITAAKSAITVRQAVDDWLTRNTSIALSVRGSCVICRRPMWIDGSPGSRRP
jgi:hypothetical protein